MSDKFNLDPNEPAEEAIRRISLALMERAMAQNEGILADRDTECLHLYRVNIRKLRSLLSLTKQIFDPVLISPIRSQLSALFENTNKLRDLDTILLEQRQYRKYLPKKYKEVLSELFVQLHKERQQEYSSVRCYMQTKEYQNLILNISKVMSGELEYASELARVPVLVVAKDRIIQCYTRVFRMIRRLDSCSSHADIHSIRIGFKKLRYLLELFSEVFRDKKYNKIIRRTKKLQDALGRYNDYFIQQQFLMNYTDASRYSKQMVIAVKGLLKKLRKKQKNLRKKLRSALQEFLLSSIKCDFQYLFY